eukprot:446414_1
MDKRRRDKKKNQQTTYAILGGLSALVVVGFVAYWYSASPQKDETEQKEQEEDPNKIEQITYAGDDEDMEDALPVDSKPLGRDIQEESKSIEEDPEVARNDVQDKPSTLIVPDDAKEVETTDTSDTKPIEELESRNIVPPNYFEDPIASTKGKASVKQMISRNLETFHADKRPTLDELQMRNIIHSDFCENDIGHALDLKQKRDKEREETLNDKLNHKKRPTITDLGDMHIIPHDYLDNLLEDAVAHHTRKESRMNHVQDRLQKHLPQPVAATLAETLVTSVQEDESNELEAINMNHDHPQNEDDEWQISFVYEPMQNFVPMNPAQKDEVTNKLERRLSLRPSKQQIEVWGFVPPQYFESPEQSFLRQALGREIALDLLEGFFPKREDIYQLTNRGIMHPDFIGRDHNEALKQQHERKKSVMDELNSKLDPRKRPSIIELSDQGLIPENWLLDLYGLADQVRKRHRQMDSAVLDLKSQLNVPPILADVVARDVLDEIETVDPYLKKDEEADEDEENNKKRDSIDGMDHDVQQQIEELKERIGALSSANEDLLNTINRMKEIENNHLVQINNLEKKTSIINDQSEEISRLREEQNSTELHRLDAKAIEIELSRERKNTQRLQEVNSELENQLSTANYKISINEKLVKQLQTDKIILLNKTNEQINILRDYLVKYQKYVDKIVEEKNKGMFTNIFG